MFISTKFELDPRKFKFYLDDLLLFILLACSCAFAAFSTNNFGMIGAI